MPARSCWWAGARCTRSTWPTASRPGTACRAARRQQPQRPRLLRRQPLLCPLSSAEVAAVDLDAGKIVQTSKSREGKGPRQSRLLPGQGDFPELGRRGGLLPGGCAPRGDRPPPGRQARRRRGPAAPAAKCCWTKGSWSRRSAASAAPTSWGPTSGRGELLRESLLEGLRTDFAAYRGAHRGNRAAAGRCGPAGRLLAADGRRLAEGGAAARRAGPVPATDRVGPRRSGHGGRRPVAARCGATSGFAPAWPRCAARRRRERRPRSTG